MPTLATRDFGAGVEDWQQLADTFADSPDAVRRLAAGQGLVLRRPQIRALGLDDSLIRRRLRVGEWCAPWRGWIFPAPRYPEHSPADHVIRASAAAQSRTGSIVSHASAALLHGLPVLRRPDRIRLTMSSASHGGGWPGCLVHAAPWGPTEVTTWFGVPVATPSRVCIDIARLDGVAAGLVTADAALRAGAASATELRRTAHAARRRPGVVGATRVAELAVRTAESPLESLTRLCLLDADLPEAPVPQVVITTDRGEYRVDLLMVGARLIIEADGQVKYADPSALWREKLRQDALERAGYRIARVTWEEVTRRPHQVVERVLRACATITPATF